MRHRKTENKLGRTGSHRKAMLINMSNSLIEHELIKTTVTKAKVLRQFIEPLITRSKIDSVANRRLTFDRLRSKSSVGKLFVELGPKYVERPGGYLRILKCGLRTGDKAPMAWVELMDRNIEDVLTEEALLGEETTAAPVVSADEMATAEEVVATVEEESDAKPSAKKQGAETEAVATAAEKPEEQATATEEKATQETATEHPVEKDAENSATAKK